MSKSEQPQAAPSNGLVRIQTAAGRLGASKWTLRRWHGRGWLPLVKAGASFMVPESFLLMVESSPRPGRAGDLADTAAEWFRIHAGEFAELIKPRVPSPREVVAGTRIPTPRPTVAI